MTEVRFRGEQKGFNQAGGGVTVVTAGGGGAGGGGEKKEEGFGFIGGGSMKDWLIIMVVVVVGLMFLTHSIGVPGQKGPNGGYAAFAATGQLIGSMMQWATFLLANPGIILFAFMCRSKTFRRYFPLGLIHEDLGITGFCNRFENLGEYSLWGMIKNPGRATKLQAMAAEIGEQKETLVEAVLKDKALGSNKNVKLLFNTVDNIGTLTPGMAKATSMEEWNDALKEALDDKNNKTLRESNINQKMRELTDFLDSEPGKKILNDPKMITAITSARVSKSSQDLTNGWATMEATIGRTEAVKVTTADEMLAFFAENPYNLAGVHKGMNVPRLVGKEVDSRFKTIINTATQDTDAAKMVKSQLKRAFREVDPLTVNALAEAIASLTNDQLATGAHIIDDLKLTEAYKANPSLKEAVDKLTDKLKNKEGEDMEKSLNQFGDKTGNELAEATDRILRDVKK